LIRFEATAEAASHEVLIGPIKEAAEAIRALGGGHRLPLVTDSNVLALYGERLRPLFDFDPLLVPEGEKAKSWGTLERLVFGLSELGASRKTPVIALGGGSVGDVAGLAAALFKRGCPVIHLPTTLLAQVDSAVGGKTAIDAAGKKNLVGAFHAPALVVADPAFLETLDERQLRAGYAEVVKYGLIDDPVFFAWCEANGSELHAIEHCLRAKALLVGDDFRDTSGRRALLNLGHSFAHAIEALAGLGSVLHGEAVAVGMVLAFGFSAAQALCPASDVDRVSAHLAAVGLPTRLADVGLDSAAPALMQLIRSDKKAVAGEIALILARGIGKAFLDRDVDQVALERFLRC
jgi:3-dehydroquinate synthase